jgi:hypothetical protein
LSIAIEAHQNLKKEREKKNAEKGKRRKIHTSSENTCIKDGRRPCNGHPEVFQLVSKGEAELGSQCGKAQSCYWQLKKIARRSVRTYGGTFL